MPEDCQEEFVLKFPIDHIEEFMKTLQDAFGDEDLKTNWERITTLKSEIQTLLNAAEEIQLSMYKIVVLLGGIKFSSELIEHLGANKVTVLAVTNKEELEQLIADKKKDEPKIKAMIVVAKETDDDLVLAIYDVLSTNSPIEVYVYCLTDEKDGDVPEGVDYPINNEADIDWTDIDLQMESSN